MIVIVTQLMPKNVLGIISRYLMEVSSGTFVGKLRTDMREELWGFIKANAKSGRAVLIVRANNSQGYVIDQINHEMSILDFEGVTLIRRTENKTSNAGKGWSKARRNMKRR